MSERAERWWLVTHLSPADPETKSDLEILREVDADDVRETREANALLTRLAGVAPYARLVELYEDLLEAHGREASAKRRAAEMNRAARALGKVAQELPNDLRRNAAADFGADSEEARQLETALAEETARAPFRLLAAVGTLQQGPFAADDDALVNDADAVAALAADVPEISRTTDFVRTLGAGVVVAQRLMGRQLQIYETRIDEASLHLRRLAAEVADGAPALMRASDFDPEAGQTNLGQTTFDALALDKAVYLHRALRHARRLLDATNDVAIEPTAAPAVDSAPTTETVAEDVPPPSAVGDDVENADSAAMAADETVAEAPAPVEQEPPEPPLGDRADQVLDLGALARHATEFIDELERAWSAALDDVLLAEAQDEMNARLSSLLRSIQRRAAAGDRAADTAGLDARLPALPLSPEEITRLTLEPDPEQRWRQLRLAEVEALVLLTDALHGLRQPSAGTIYVDENRVETWWEAGAFALVRERAELLVRVSEELANAEAAVLGRTTDTTPSSALLSRLSLARDALGRGDVEATLLHSRIALALCAGVEVDVLPADFVAQLANDARLAAEAPLLRLLDRAAEKLAAGEELDLGAAMVTAPRALAVVGRICLEMPGVLGDVLARDNDESA